MIVASERLTGLVEDWLEVPINHVLQVNANMNVLLYPLEDLVKKLPVAPLGSPASVSTVRTPLHRSPSPSFLEPGSPPAVSTVRAHATG